MFISHKLHIVNHLKPYQSNHESQDPPLNGVHSSERITQPTHRTLRQNDLAVW